MHATSGVELCQEWGQPHNLDRHVGAESVAAEEQIGVLERLATRGDDVRADDLVAELARDALRLRILCDVAGDRLARAQVVEGEVEDGGSHLRAETSAL